MLTLEEEAEEAEFCMKIRTGRDLFKKPINVCGGYGIFRKDLGKAFDFGNQVDKLKTLLYGIIYSKDDE